jgi:hypothetical protein
MASEAPRRWRYEADEEPKRKHGWHKDGAGFVDQDGVPVGKCPIGMSREEAEALLNDGIAYDPAGSGGAPPRIYAICDGVLYRAVPTREGVYHGFPEHPRYFRKLPLRFQERILEHARERGQAEALRRWLNR